MLKFLLRLVFGLSYHSIYRFDYDAKSTIVIELKAPGIPKAKAAEWGANLEQFFGCRRVMVLNETTRIVGVLDKD